MDGSTIRFLKPVCLRPSTSATSTTAIISFPPFTSSSQKKTASARAASGCSRHSTSKRESTRTACSTSRGCSSAAVSAFTSGYSRSPTPGSHNLLGENLQLVRIENDPRPAASLDKFLAFKLTQQVCHGLARDARHIAQSLMGERYAS